MIDTVVQFRFIVKSGRLIIADPSVFDDTEKMVKLRNVRNGIWTVQLIFSMLGTLERVLARHEKESVLRAQTSKREIALRSSQIGLFDASNYRNDAQIMGMPIESYKTYQKGDLWYCAMCYITNHAPQGAGAFGYGVITDSDHKSHIVVSKKSWEGEFVEVEILKK